MAIENCFPMVTVTKCEASSKRAVKKINLACVAVARQRPHSASTPEGQNPAESGYPADEAPDGKAPAPRGAPDVVLVNDARKELIGKQRGAFKVHRISPKNEALPAASRIGRRDSRRRVLASTCFFSSLVVADAFAGQLRRGSFKTIPASEETTNTQRFEAIPGWGTWIRTMINGIESSQRVLVCHASSPAPCSCANTSLVRQY